MADRVKKEIPWQRVEQVLEPVFDENTRVLILGTAPSLKSRESGFFYGHPQNRFWKVLAALTEEEIPKTKEEKHALLLKHHIGLYDVIRSCDIQGSSDSSIRNEEPSNLLRIFHITGEIPVFGNGGTAYRLYCKHQEAKTGILMRQLPSTSPANAVWTLDKLTAVWGEALLPYLEEKNRQ